MGNKFSCCWYKHDRNRPNATQRPKAPEEKYIAQEHERPINHGTKQLSNSANLQHISDREPDDSEYDPSNHPKVKTIFLERSKSEIQRNKNRRRSQYDYHHRHHNHTNEFTQPTIRKYSSCSTIFIDDSTVSQPNLKNTLKAVALAIYFHIKNRMHRTPAELEGRLLDIFDERLHPLTKDKLPEDYDRHDPEHRTIYRFIRTLFTSAQLTAECAIVTLVYLERLLTYAEIEIVPGNWRRIVLGAILLASKVWDDQAVWNVDYCQILKDTSVEDMNELERQFLEMLQFNINVPSSVYAKYYFDLRALGDAHGLTLPPEQLSKQRANKLEAMSNVLEDKLQKQVPSKLRRSHSLDGLTQSRRNTRAILS